MVSIGLGHCSSQNVQLKTPKRTFTTASQSGKSNSQNVFAVRGNILRGINDNLAIIQYFLKRNGTIHHTLLLFFFNHAAHRHSSFQDTFSDHQRWHPAFRSIITSHVALMTSQVEVESEEIAINCTKEIFLSAWLSLVFIVPENVCQSVHP